MAKLPDKKKGDGNRTAQTLKKSTKTKKTSKK
jgi:hypothetical protein